MSVDVIPVRLSASCSGDSIATSLLCMTHLLLDPLDNGPQQAQTEGKVDAGPLGKCLANAREQPHAMLSGPTGLLEQCSIAFEQTCKRCLCHSRALDRKSTRLTSSH